MAKLIAKDAFLQVVSKLIFADVMENCQGPEDSVTSYFRE
jgi:hypothetical protein